MICREAAILALREDMKSKDVTMKHFEKALQVVRPSVDKEIEETYKELEKYFSVAKAREIKEEKPMYVG